MTTYSAILIASLALLLSFAIERACGAIRLPAVVALIGVGMLAKPVFDGFGLRLEGLDGVVPVVGTLGLVLIVLEGALDIQLSRERLRHALSAMVAALAGFGVCVVALTPMAMAGMGVDLFSALIIVVPFAVISSAVAIPSSQFLPEKGREFVVYESSVSDILGVLVFFALIGSDGTAPGVLSSLLGGGVLSFALSVICALGLALVLVRVEGHVRFLPVLAALFALYAIGKLFHLSPLIMVLLFGLAINNPELLARAPFCGRWMQVDYATTLAEFKSLAQELTFAVRGFFFMMLGYWTDFDTLVAPEAWIGALVILLVVYLGRHALLGLIKVDSREALLWIAPRGLITVLLFLNARAAVTVPDFLLGSVVIVVMTTALLIIPAARGRVSRGG
jgi:hypothetical protein